MAGAMDGGRRASNRKVEADPASFPAGRIVWNSFAPGKFMPS
ncbi:hypothetical protein [Azospirillum palustre]